MEFSRQEYWSGLPFPSRRFSPHRDWTQVSFIAGKFLPSEPPGKTVPPVCIEIDDHLSVFNMSKMSWALKQPYEASFSCSWRNDPDFSLYLERNDINILDALLLVIYTNTFVCFCVICSYCWKMTLLQTLLFWLSVSHKLPAEWLAGRTVWLVEKLART